jgi:hypothetical protein
MYSLHSSLEMDFTLIGMSLVKASRARAGDRVTLGMSPRKQQTVYITHKGSQIGRLDTRDSQFLSELLRMQLCTLQASIVMIPERLRVSEEIILAVQVDFTDYAFIAQDDVYCRKVALTALFQRTGLLDAPDRVRRNAELTVSDLAYIYRKANQLDKHIDTMHPSPGFNLELRDYQATALAFMYSKESGFTRQATISPLWRQVY